MKKRGRELSRVWSSLRSCSELYLEKAFKKEDLSPVRRLPVARELGETGLMFLIHPTLTPEHMQSTCAAVEKVMLLASR